MAETRFTGVSAVVLTQGVRSELTACLKRAAKQDPPFNEIVVVNNASVDVAPGLLEGVDTERLVILSTGANFGTAARNAGSRMASGEVVVFLDDDVLLESDDVVAYVRTRMAADEGLAAICFHVRGRSHGDFDPAMWGHPRSRLQWQHAAFRTDTITEGAFAVRTDIFRQVGGFWPGIFIGEEGVDLFCRLHKAGHVVLYDPHIRCLHEHASAGRPALRSYYHYARSAALIAWRHMSWWQGTRFMARSVALILIQAMRRGSLKACGMAILGAVDGWCWVGGAGVERRPMDADARRRWEDVRKQSPSVLARLRNQVRHRTL